MANHLTVITTTPAISVAPAQKKQKTRHKTIKMFFKRPTLETAEQREIIKLIEANPGFTAVEYAAKFCAANGRPQKERGQKTILINYLLAESPQGNVLAANGHVKLAPLGRKPKWFFTLSAASKAIVKTATAQDQAARLSFAIDPNADKPFCDEIADARKGYAEVSGFGKSRWFSQDRLRQLENADTRLIASTAEFVEAKRLLAVAQAFSNDVRLLLTSQTKGI